MGTIATSGSATTVRWLIADDLVDELHLSSETLDTGVLHAVCAPAG